MRNSFVLCAVVLASACMETQTPADAGRWEAGAGAGDAGSDESDATSPIEDASTPEDAGQDSSLPFEDAGPQSLDDADLPDAMPPPVDVDADAPDAGHATPVDAGTDASEPSADAGETTPDAGTGQDAGSDAGQSCTALQAPENGNISYSASTSVGSVATYACRGDLTPSPSATRTCRAGSTGPRWDGQVAYCVGCGDGLVSQGEECDPKAPNENVWTCSSPSCTRNRHFRRCSGDPRSSGCWSLEVCMDGMCVPTCQPNLDLECPPLPSGVPESMSAECQLDQSGVTGRCFVEGCTSSADCPSGAICSSGRCTGCGSSSQCPAETPTCVAVSGISWFGSSCQVLSSCTSYQDCAPGLVCRPGGAGNPVNTCAKCSVDSDCPAETPYCWSTYNYNDSCLAVEP